MNLDGVVLHPVLLQGLADPPDLAVDLIPEHHQGLAVDLRRAAEAYALDHVHSLQLRQVRGRLIPVPVPHGPGRGLLLVLGHPGPQSLVQGVQLDGFGDKVVEPILQEILLHPLHGVGGEGDDGHHGKIGVLFAHLPDPLGGLHPVHIGHHVVHEHQVRPHLGHLPQGLLAGPGGVDLHLVGPQQALADLQVQGLIVHHQHRRLGGGEAVVILVALRADIPPVGAAGGGVHHLLGQAHPEVAAHPVGALHPQLAVHQLRQLLADGKPQAGALNVPVGPPVQAAVAAEDVGHVLLPDAHAGVLHVDHQGAVLHRRLPGDGHGHRALVGVLHRVGA